MTTSGHDSVQAGTALLVGGDGRILISMQILLTNDDGIYAPGLAAMERRSRGWAK